MEIFFIFKSNLGAGYLLSIVKQSSSELDPILNLVYLLVPNASARNDYGEEIRIFLPFDSINFFAKLFEELEVRSNDLGITSFGVSVTTMEEVFFRLVYDYSKYYFYVKLFILNVVLFK